MEKPLSIFPYLVLLSLVPMIVDGQEGRTSYPLQSLDTKSDNPTSGRMLAKNGLSKAVAPHRPSDQIARESVPEARDNSSVAIPRTIPWSLLAPEKGKPFNDPFTKLSSDQLQDLSYVVRVWRLIVEERIDARGEDAKEAAQLASKLKQQGVDIGWLMVQREGVRQLRCSQVESLSKSIASSLQDERVSLTGYVIPITFKEGRLTEFFLVPTIAACSHEDAPPRLQVVFVSLEQGLAPPDRRTPVRVTGKVAAETTTRTTFNGNGRVRFHSAYAMSSPVIEVFRASGKTDNQPQ